MAMTSVVEACNNFLLALLAPLVMWLPASADGNISQRCGPKGPGTFGSPALLTRGRTVGAGFRSSRILGVA